MPASAYRTRRAKAMGLLALALALLAAFCWGSVSYISSVEDQRVREEIDSISGDDMIATVQDLQNLGSRAFCVNQSREAAEYIYGRFHELGLDVSYQNFSFSGYSASNVVAVVQGSKPDARVLLFGAHYDSENNMATDLSMAEALPAPGADDDASGVAAVIELAEALRDVRSEQTLKFVAFGAEELGFDDAGGLKGSSHFVALEKAGGEVYECAVVLDMIGYAGSLGDSGVIVTSSADVPFAASADKAVGKWDLRLHMRVERNSMITYSDHASFWYAGYPAVLVVEELSESGRPINPHYHSSDDTVERLSEPQMENLTRCLLASALAILDSPENNDALMTALMATVFAAGTAATATIAFMLYDRKRRKGDRR
ncbi:MAG: M20/M25/M40 family metallo-hydrolase [Candidatus Thermoplasmatota archaeon]|nr:M20/M25/M40 family metallo-hydrolase [Candidatus Thermoplasmatota archaeon]